MSNTQPVRRTQPTVQPSVSNRNPTMNVSTQFSPGNLIGGAIGGLISGAKRLGTSIARNASAGFHNAENAIFGNPAQRATAQQRVHDVTNPQTRVITPGYNNTGRIDALSGWPIGKWAFNQDNSGGMWANIHENDDMRNEYGGKLTKANGFHLQDNQVFPYTSSDGVTMNATREDFEKEKGSNEWDDFKPVKDVVAPVTKTIYPFGANTNYQLGKQGVVGASGTYLGNQGTPTSVTAPNVGRNNGSLTNGMWQYGAGGTGYAGGASASSFQGITGDEGHQD